jgi:uncharacterized protein YdhG (YjbR/CyaY superfamily)
MQKATSVDAYIASFPAPTRKLLETLRRTIRAAAPDADEVIAYGMPAYKQGGPLVYFAGYGGHIGFYPTGTGIAAFVHELGAFKSSKGAVQFPLDAPLPLDLVRRMVAFKLAEVTTATAAKAAAQKATKKTATTKAATKKTATTKAATKKTAKKAATKKTAKKAATKKTAKKAATKKTAKKAVGHHI